MENYEQYFPENHGLNADKAFKQKNSKATWYSISNSVRVDFVKKIRITDVEYFKFRIGLRTDSTTFQIFETEDVNMRFLPYANKL